jgi:hypothetical protein
MSQDSQFRLFSDGLTEIEAPELQTIASNYILYDEEQKDAFMEWWEGTSWMLTAANKSNIKMPSWGSSKVSPVWLHFSEVAHKNTGEPKVLCMVCQHLLAHPSIKNTGTSTMQSHVNSKNCRKVGVKKGYQSISLILTSEKVCYSTCE